MEISDEARRLAQLQWKRKQNECGHPKVEVVEIDHREYGICKECQWLMPGYIAQSYLRLRS